MSMTMYLYRKTRQAVILASAMAALLGCAQAQFRAPQPERKTPRAIGVLETFKNGSRRLLPVSYFYERHYYDATFYHATPVPFTLHAETVYEVQHLGQPLGTFTVQNASREQAAWWGSGRFKAAPDAATLARRKALRPVVLEDPARPVLHRRAGSEGDRPAAHAASAAGAPEAAKEDTDRPKLHRREGSEGGAAETAVPAPTAAAPEAAQVPAQVAASTTAGVSAQDPNRPVLHRRDEAAEGKNAAAVTSAAPAAVAAAPAAELTPSEDLEHPILRRGKPVQEQSGSDLPDFKKEEPVLRQAAVSDAGPSEVPVLLYVCTEQERAQMEASARELARGELRRLGAQRGLRLPAAAETPAAQATRGGTPSKKAAPEMAMTPFALEDEQFVPYDLDYNNYATVVFSARYAAEASAAGAAGKSWVVTVVARQSEDKLIQLYGSVSDPWELDLYPEVRLVDAVDPDGYGRYVLLFREQKREGASWLLGRVTGYELQTLFETAAR
jgi:hypothetical protein